MAGLGEEGARVTLELGALQFLDAENAGPRARLRSSW